MAHWTERLYQEQADLFAGFLDRRFEQAEAEVEALLALLADRHDVTPERVLDVACGIGRHAVAFAGAGSDVTGVDISATFIERARDRAGEAGVSDRVEFRVGDMRDAAEWDGAYDLITLFWNSLGYYDRQTDREVLTALAGLRSDGGVLALEASNLPAVLREYDPTGVREVGGRLHVERREFAPATGRFHTTVDLFDVAGDGYDYTDTIEFSPRLYAPVELRELCLAAGFDEVSLYGDFEGADLSVESDHVVAVAE